MVRSVRAILAITGGLALFAWLPMTPAYAHHGQPPFYSHAEIEYQGGQRMSFVADQNTGRVFHCVGDALPCYDFGPIGAIGTPTATINCEGKMHVFVVGYNYRLYVKWQVNPRSTIWSHPWFDLGGALTSNPEAYTNHEGRMEVFARGADHAVWTRWQTSRCGAWSHWASIGGTVLNGPELVNWTQVGHVLMHADGNTPDRHTWEVRRGCWTCPWVWSPANYNY
jgi:hypothetical protein